MYRFQKGDKVRHIENEISGEVVRLLTLDEESGEPDNQLNPDVPWYNVKWSLPGNQSWIGFEADGSLEPIG